jgi:hypothetical protein
MPVARKWSPECTGCANKRMFQWQDGRREKLCRVFKNATKPILGDRCRCRARKVADG